MTTAPGRGSLRALVAIWLALLVLLAWAQTPVPSGSTSAAALRMIEATLSVWPLRSQWTLARCLIRDCRTALDLSSRLDTVVPTNRAAEPTPAIASRRE